MLEKDAYHDQLASAKNQRSIGELSRSPVFGASPLVPDMGGRSRRFPKEKSKSKNQAFHL